MSSSASEFFGQRLSNRDDVGGRCKMVVGVAGTGVVAKGGDRGSILARIFSFCFKKILD